MKTKQQLPPKGTPEWHQLVIAKRTFNMPIEIAGLMGGMTMDEAIAILKKWGYKLPKK